MPRRSRPALAEARCRGGVKATSLLRRSHGKTAAARLVRRRCAAHQLRGARAQPADQSKDREVLP
eukprot:9130364-Pyramimonas_sp.AAC.1